MVAPQTTWTRGLLAVVLALLVGWSAGGCPPRGTDDVTETPTNTTGQPDTGGTSAPTTTDVELKNLAYSPAEVTIRAGDTVRWVNRESARIIHNVVSGDPNAADAGQVFRSADLGPSESFAFEFTAVGTYRYHCTFHPTKMRDATVIVAE